jgi:flagellum-specific peptidoglycan hydrolase FlgJ
VNNSFINWFGGLVSRISENSAYFPSVLIAQGILESNYGKSSLSVIHNNFFGIKAGESWTGSTVNMSTGEVFNGQSVTIQDEFRVYKEPEQSIKDRINWMMNSSRYNGVKAATTPEAQAQAIQSASYATDPNYSSKLIALIDKYNLKQFDQNRDTMKNISIAISVLLIAAAALTIYKTVKY